MIQPHSQELLGELPHDVAPKVEGVRLVPWRQAAGLELAGGIASFSRPAVAMLFRLPRQYFTIHAQNWKAETHMLRYLGAPPPSNRLSLHRVSASWH